MKSEQLLRFPQLSEIFQWSSHTKHFKPQHQYAYSPFCSSYISYGTEEENLFHNRQLLQQVIISFILATVMCDPGVILQGEVRCQSLHWVQGLSEKETEKNTCEQRLTCRPCSYTIIDLFKKLLQENCAVQVTAVCFKIIVAYGYTPQRRCESYIVK